MLPPLQMPSKIYYFSQSVPIPSYLIALAAGELKSKEIGPISRVWSEPALVTPNITYNPFTRQK